MSATGHAISEHIQILLKQQHVGGVLGYIGRRVDRDADVSISSPRRVGWACWRLWVNDAGMSVATVVVEAGPDRHALVMPDCECGTCAPTWARRRGKSRRFTEPVTLVAALEREEAGAWQGMVEQHRQSVEELTAATDRVIAVTGRDDAGRPGVGLALLMWAAELASPVRPDEYRSDLPAGLVAGCEQAVTAAALAAAACMSGFAETLEVLAGLLGYC